MTMPPVFFPHYDSARRRNGRWDASHFPRWTPQDRFNSSAVFNAVRSHFARIPTTEEMAALRSIPSQHTYTTINCRPELHILEMAYPGNRFPALQDKWIYGFHFSDRRCVFEIYAESENRWRYRLNPTPESLTNANPTLPLTAIGSKLVFSQMPGAIAQTVPSDFGFMLSPFRLSANGMRHILQQRIPERDSMPLSLVRPRFLEGHGFWVVALPDPYSWAVDTHQKYYEAARNTYENWLNNFDRQATRTIAGVLKKWIETNNDVFGVNDNLRVHPDTFFNHYNDEERDVRFPMELAGLYLNRWSDQPDHRAVELSAQERRGQELSTTVQMWAITTQNLVASRTGRQMAENLVQPSNNRVPRQLVFPSSTSTEFQMDFPNMRYAWLAGVAIFDALQPVWLNNFLMRLTKAERASRETYVRAKRYPERMLSIVNQILPANGNWRNLSQFYISNSQGVHFGTVLDADTIADSVDRLYRDYRNPLSQLRFSAAFVFEGFNVYFALNSMWDDLSENRDINILGLSGTSADMLAMIFGYMQRRAEVTAAWNNVVRNAGSTILPSSEHAIEASGSVAAFRALGFVAGFAGGVFQCLDEMNQSVTAGNQGQSWQQIGHGTAAAGAAGSAIGAALTFLGFSLCGGWITAGGAALIAGGNLLALALRRNEYEVFAANCFMGFDYDEDALSPITPTWAQSELNTRSLRSQLRVLQGILLSFSVRLHNSEIYSQISSNYVQIDFGLLPPDAVLTIKLEQSYRSGLRVDHHFTQTYVVRVSSIPHDSDRVSWSHPNNSGTMLSYPDAMRVERNREKYITKLIFKVTPLTVMLNGQSCLFNQFDKRMDCINSIVKVKLRASGISNPRDPERFLKIDLKESGSNVISCLESDKWDPRL